jgi:ubiquinone/menaquinone biosynthesis C-methylase UbiE
MALDETTDIQADSLLNFLILALIMGREALYRKFAKYYDKIYSVKDYEEEVEFIKWAAGTHRQSRGRELLDVPCGTGNHAALLKDDFSITGMDKSNDMLKIARKKVKGAEFLKGDMEGMDLRRRFDLIICMFGSINYSVTYEELERVLKRFRKHLKKGGVLIFDLGFNRENWIERYVNIDTLVEDDLELARISQSHSRGDIFDMNFIFLVKEKGKLDFMIDQHKLGIFEISRVRRLMNKVGFKTYIYSNYTSKAWRKGLNRPVFVGVRQK